MPENVECLKRQLDTALNNRLPMLDEKHEGAIRLFNGFIEGHRALVCDLYGRTLLLHNYAKVSAAGSKAIDLAQAHLLASLPWIDCVLVKERFADSAETRNGRITFGDKPTRAIREHGVRYAVDLKMNRDASFYLDTRNLRQWLLENSAEKTLLNTFAYTGSLGVAATAGGAANVLQTDLNKRFLSVAKESYSLNRFPITKADFQAVDFWSYMSRLKRAGRRFDIVLLDPPFFAETDDGRVDLSQNVARLINKVRPLVKNGGRIVAINNALFLSGQAYMQSLEALCEGGWVEIEALLPISADFSGFPDTMRLDPITNPSPFNHSTKIAILKISHRD